MRNADSAVSYITLMYMWYTEDINVLYVFCTCRNFQHLLKRMMPCRGKLRYVHVYGVACIEKNYPMLITNSCIWIYRVKKRSFVFRTRPSWRSWERWIQNHHTVYRPNLVKRSSWFKLLLMCSLFVSFTVLRSVMRKNSWPLTLTSSRDVLPVVPRKGVQLQPAVKS